MDTFFHLFSPFFLFFCGTIRLVVYTPLLLVSSVPSPLHIPANYLPLSVSTSLPKCRVLLHIVFCLIFPGPYIDILSYPRVSSFFSLPTHLLLYSLPCLRSYSIIFFPLDHLIFTHPHRTSHITRYIPLPNAATHSLPGLADWTLHHPLNVSAG